MPIPALNIMATHEMVLNSGSSFCAPSFMTPNRLNARYIENPTNPMDDRMNTQPKLGIRKSLRTALNTV